MYGTGGDTLVPCTCTPSHASDLGILERMTIPGLEDPVAVCVYFCVCVCVCVCEEGCAERRIS